jgi:hypothetical protein
MPPRIYSTCQLPGCSNPHYATGLCRGHYVSKRNAATRAASYPISKAAPVPIPAAPAIVPPAPVLTPSAAIPAPPAAAEVYVGRDAHLMADVAARLASGTPFTRGVETPPVPPAPMLPIVPPPPAGFPRSK